MVVRTAAVSCAGTGWPQQIFHPRKGVHPMLPFETVVRINLFGTFNAMRYAAAAMAVVLMEVLGPPKAKKNAGHE